MPLVVTFVAPFEASDLLKDLCAAMAPGLAPIWLCEGRAAEVSISGDLLPLRQKAQELSHAKGVDVCVQEVTDISARKKRMLIADMDSTIIGQECIDEMADMMGLKPEIAAITERAMQGELDFEAALHARIALLKGFAKADLGRVLETRITLNPGAKTLVTTMAAHGAYTMLVSGGFLDFTRVVAAHAGFAKTKANEFIWQDEKLAGVREPILGRQAKLEALDEECKNLAIVRADVLAVGDGANDLAMLGAAGLGVAYRAKPVVATQADAQVKFTDLTSLLYFQGYPREAFILVQ